MLSATPDLYFAHFFVPYVFSRLFPHSISSLYGCLTLLRCIFFVTTLCRFTIFLVCTTAFINPATSSILICLDFLTCSRFCRFIATENYHKFQPPLQKLSTLQRTIYQRKNYRKRIWEAVMTRLSLKKQGKIFSNPVGAFKALISQMEISMGQIKNISDR